MGAEDLGLVPDEPQAPPMPSPQQEDLGLVPEEPDLSAIKEHTSNNVKMQAAQEKEKAKTATGPKQEILQPVHPAKNLQEALEAGWQTGFAGLFSRGKAPDVVLPEDASRAMKIASQVASLAGDIPAMAAGAVGGLELGPVGAAAGAFAVPAAMRKILMDHYQKGDIMSAGDFADRVVGTAWEGIKGATTGAAVALTGGAAGTVAGPLASYAAEVATLATVSKGLEGKLPNADDFINGAIVIGGLKALGSGTDTIGQKLRGVYEQTGALPSDVVNQAVRDPILKQEILSDNIEAQHISVPSPEEQATKGLPQFTEKDLAEEPGKVQEAYQKQQPQQEAPPTKELSSSEQKILSRVGVEPEAQGKGIDWHQIYTDRIDFLHQLKVAVDAGPEVTADKNAYVIGRTMSAYTDKVRSFFENGTRDFKTGEVNGEPLKQIFDDVGKDNMDKFRAFVISKRAIELDRRGIETGMPLEDAKQVVNDGQSQFGDLQKRLVDYRGRTLEYMKDSGFFNDTQFKNMMELNKEHVPFHRILEPDPVTGKIPGQGKGVRRIKGSDLQIKDPLLETFKDTDMMIKLAEENKMRSSFIDQIAGAGPEDQILRKSESNMQPIDVGAEEIKKALAKQGIDVDPDGITVFRPMNKMAKANETYRYIDGKREVYEGNRGVIEALNSFSGNEAGANLFTSMMKPFANSVRAGFTTNPAFALRHFTRAQMFSGLTTKTGLLPFYHPAMALGDFFGNGGKGTELYHQWLFDGGAQRSFEPIGENYVKEKIMDLDKDTPFIKQGWNTITSPFKAAHAFIQLSDNLTRFAEYKRSPGIASGDATPAERAQAAMNSREVTPDYSRVGAKMAAVQQSVAFMNAGLQGIDLATRQFANDPVGATAKSLAYFTVPALLTWYATHDDERYKSLPHWEKDLYLNIPVDHWRDSTPQEYGPWEDKLKRMNNGVPQVNDGLTFKIPQTFDVGLVFGSLPMRILDHYVDHDPTAMQDVLKSIREKIPGLPIPNAIQPMIEQMTNYNFFTGTPVVPDSKKRLLPELQYNEYTSETAKSLAKLIGYVPGLRDIGPGNNTLASPMVIDNYLKSWGGSMGQYAVQLIDKASPSAPVKPETRWSELPFAKEFFARYPDSHAQQIQDFLNREVKAETIDNSVKALVGQGKFKEAMQLKMDYQDQAPKLAGIKIAINRQSHLVEGIQQKIKDPVQMRQLQDGLYFQMIRAAKIGNKAIDDLEKMKGNN